MRRLTSWIMALVVGLYAVPGVAGWDPKLEDKSVAAIAATDLSSNFGSHPATPGTAYSPTTSAMIQLVSLRIACAPLSY